MKSDPMEQNFAGYLLNALCPAEHQQVEAYLRARPEARARLALLEQALAPLAEDAAQPPPPPGLVVATLARIGQEMGRRPPDAPRPWPDRGGSGGGWRWARRADMAVAASLLLLLGALAAPFLVKTWRGSQRVACANNLRAFWGGLQAYSDRTNDNFPQVEPEGARGIGGVFVPILNDAGALGDASVSCPAQGLRPAPRCTVEELENLYRTDPAQYQAVAATLSGNYAYCLGYREGGAHRGLRRGCGDHLPIMADRSQASGGNSLNHGGDGQNVLYIGGNVRWCVQTTVGEGGDDIYLNQRYQLGAGLNRADTVLGASDARPYR